MVDQPQLTGAPARAAAPAPATPGAQALYSVATSFDAGAAPRDILAALVRRAATALGARCGWLLAPLDHGEEVAAAWPDPETALPDPGSAPVLRLPLVDAGRPAGTLLLGSPSAGAFGPAERRLAAAVARPAGAVAALAFRLAALEDDARRSREAAALAAGVVGAVDHDLRTPLTTVLGALQMLARPEFAPADPDLQALLVSALGQARRLRALLDDLRLASPSSSLQEPLTPEALRALIAEAARAGMGEGAVVPVDIPDGLPPMTVDPPALRRVLAGILRGACRRGLSARVEVAAWGEAVLVAVTADGDGPLVPDLSARLAAAMGATLEEAAGVDGTVVVQLLLPGARPIAPPAQAP